MKGDIYQWIIFIKLKAFSSMCLRLIHKGNYSILKLYSGHEKTDFIIACELDYLRRAQIRQIFSFAECWIQWEWLVLTQCMRAEMQSVSQLRLYWPSRYAATMETKQIASQMDGKQCLRVYSDCGEGGAEGEIKPKYVHICTYIATM